MKRLVTVVTLAIILAGLTLSGLSDNVICIADVKVPDARTTIGATEIASPLDAEWVRKADTPSPGGYGEAVTGVGANIYIARCLYATSSSQFWRYDPSSNDWNSLSTSGLPTGAFRSGTARLPSTGSYSGPEVTLENNPPNTPSNPSPANHATGVDINTDLSWSGGDPDASDTVTYDVYFGTSSTPPLVSNDQLGTTYDPGTLACNDGLEAWLDYSAQITPAAVYLCTVYEDGDLVGAGKTVEAFVATEAAPRGSGTTDADGVALLQFAVVSADVGQDLRFEVDGYDATESPDVDVSIEGLEVRLDYTVETVITKYYWKVVATDNHGASTAGPLWDFTTGPPGPTVTWDLPWGLDADPAAVNIWVYPQHAVQVTLASVEWSMPSGLLIWYYGGPAVGWRFYKKGWGAVNTLEMLTPGKGYIGIVPTASVWQIPQG